MFSVLNVVFPMNLSITLLNMSGLNTSPCMTLFEMVFCFVSPAGVNLNFSRLVPTVQIRATFDLSPLYGGVPYYFLATNKLDQSPLPLAS